MKFSRGAATALLVFGTALMFPAASSAAGGSEYAIIQWWGGHNTQVVWPDGHVDLLEHLLPTVELPEHAHERAYVMSLLMNKLAKDGYEYAGMASGEEIVMRRARP